MARTFQIKRGAKANMPTLAQGEFGFVTDSGAEELYIGNGSENIQIARQDEMPGLATTTEAGLVTVDGTAGIGVNTENGNLFIKQATESDIDDKQHSYKPITPENLDYAVKAGIVNNANALTDDEKAAALEWLGVSAINPEFNLSSHQIANATYLGENITEGAENDTVEFWADRQSGRAWFSTEGMLIDQPSQYGFLINHTYAADVFQIFRSQSGGPTYWRSGNQEGWDGTWAQVPVLNENGELIIDGNVKGIYTIGEWLQTTADTHRSEAAEKYAVLDGSGWIYHRTPEEVRSDIGAAPAGYGLGEAQKHIENADDAKVSGFYKASKGHPFDYGSASILVVGSATSSTELLTQMAFGINLNPTSQNAMASRYWESNAWSTWEWINPPFKPNVEYRTTERIDSKVVYKRNNNGIIEYRLEDETEWKPYADAVGAAPAGFGLGEQRIPHIDKATLDTTYRAGWYMFYDDASPLVFDTFTINWGLVHTSGENRNIASMSVQELHTKIGGVPTQIVRRHETEGWSLPEFVNPPMAFGVEYRTTERIAGKAVYKRNNNGVIEYRLDGETTWKPYATAVGAAPAGYGLGSVDCRDIDGNDCNNALESGNYWISTTTANTPTSAWNGVMQVTSRSSKLKVQTIFYLADARTFVVERNFNNNVFGAWRWVNPPMQSGEEYLTTESIGYKAVYKRNNGGVIEYRLEDETEWKPYAAAIGGMQSNPNLLRNWYFGNPVNRRGQTTYPRSIDYCIDGWKRYNYAMDVLDDCIRIYNGGHQISQFFECPLSGTLTASVLFKNRTGTELRFGWNNAAETALTFVGSTSDNEGLFTATFDAVDMTEILIGSRSGGTDDSCDLIAAKLEFGSVQTLAHQDSNGNWVLNEIPDNNEELLKCIQSTADSGDTYANKVIYHTGNKPTAADVGAVNKAGDTMTGRLNVPYLTTTDLIAPLEIGCNLDMRVQGFADYAVRISTDDTCTLYMHPWGGSRQTILHTGNKNLITAADVGAAPADIKTINTPQMNYINILETAKDLSICPLNTTTFIRTYDAVDAPVKGSAYVTIRRLNVPLYIDVEYLEAGSGRVWRNSIYGSETWSGWKEEVAAFANNLAVKDTSGKMASHVCTWDGATAGITGIPWSQGFTHSDIGKDYGAFCIGVRPSQYVTGGTEVCLMIDGDYYSMGHKVLHTGNVVSSATDITAGSSASWQQYHVYE